MAKVMSLHCQLVHRLVGILTTNGICKVLRLVFGPRVAAPLIAWIFISLFQPVQPLAAMLWSLILLELKVCNLVH